MITDPGEVLNPPPSYQNHRVFLEVVADTGNIGGYLGTMRKPDPGHLAESGVRLFGCHRHDTGTNPPLLGAGLKGRRLGLEGDLLPPETNQLINSRHELKTPSKIIQEVKHTKRKKKCQVAAQKKSQDLIEIRPLERLCKLCYIIATNGVYWRFIVLTSILVFLAGRAGWFKEYKAVWLATSHG
jgi:hypothetical protein